MASTVIMRPTDNPSEFLIFDAVMSEDYDGSAEPTDYPVELQSDSTDHIIRAQEQLSISGVITDYPLIPQNESVPDATSYPTRGNKRSLGAFDFLRDAKDRGRRFTIQTSLLLYQNMVIQSLNVRRDSATSHIIQADISLREIVISTAEQVPIPKNIGRGRKKRIGKKALQQGVEYAVRVTKEILGAYADTYGGLVFETPDLSTGGGGLGEISEKAENLNPGDTGVRLGGGQFGGGGAGGSV